jgi:molybdenum cofactor synthesis domain-containing protein
MIHPDEALQLVLQTADKLPPKAVPLVEAHGLKLAEPIPADCDYPPFPRAMMDGYAVRVADAGRRVPVVGEVAAGQSATTPVADGQCLEIMTGAPCPPGTEAVVQTEQARRDGDQVTLPRRITGGQHIAAVGSECPLGRLVLEPGQSVTPLAVAVLASFGRTTVRVIPRPGVSVITTGGELIRPDRDPGPGQIRDSNGPMLVAMARDMGVSAPSHRHAEDRIEAILDAIEAAQTEIVLLTGGVSAGKYDLVPEALEEYGAETVFHKVRQKPGKPLLLAKKGAQLIFGLPGNPLAGHFCFHRYVAATIRLMEGKPAVREPVVGRLSGAVWPKASRTFFIAGYAERGDEADKHWVIHPLPGVSSADVFTSCPANCYVEVPPGNSEYPPGETLRFTWIGAAPWPN